MSKTSAHHRSLQVNCSMNQPIQLLADKLSSKSTDLYVFWQNYDQMYRQFNEKVNENNRLRQQIQYLKRIQNQPKQTEIRVQEDPYLKDRLKNSQNTCQLLRVQVQHSQLQLQKQKNQNRDQKLETTRLIQQINQMQILITQLRDENSQQRLSITNILQKLKQAQNQLNQHEKIYEQIQQKDIIIGKLIEKQKQMQQILEERDDQIQKLNKDFKDAKIKYQRIIKESMQSAKETVMNSLPPNYKIVSEKMRNGQY